MFVIRNLALLSLAAALLTPSSVFAAGYSLVEGYNVLDEANSPGIGALLGGTSGLERDIAVDSARGIIYIARGQTTTADRSGGVIGIAAIVITNGAQAGSNFRDTGLITASGSPALAWCQSLAYDSVSDKLWVLGGPLSASPNIFTAPGGSLGGLPNGGNPAAQNAVLTRAFQLNTNLLDVGVYVSPTVTTNGVPPRGGAPRGLAVRTVGTNTTVYVGMGNHLQAWSNESGTWQRIWATMRPPAANTIATRVGLTGFNGVNGVAVDDDGNVYFSVQNPGGRIWTVRPNLIQFVADPMSLDYNDLAFGGNSEREILPLIIATTPLLASPPQSLTFARFDSQKTLFASFVPAATNRAVTRLDIDNEFSITNSGAYIAARAVDGFGSGQPAGGQDSILAEMRLRQPAPTPSQPQGAPNNLLYSDVDSVTNPTYIYCQAYIIDTNKGQTIPTAATLKVRIPLDTNPPSILTQPQAQTLLEGGTIGGLTGGNLPLSVGASGMKPLSYQWQTNGVDLPGANSAILQIPTATTNQSGLYRVIVTNALGAITSAVVTVTVTPLVRSDAMTLLWSNATGSRPYLANDGTQRGLTYNLDQNHVLVVSRTPNDAVYVLDAETGNDLYQLSVGGVTGGTFAVNKIGAADDGRIFISNLAQNGQDFRIYRWVIEETGVTPTLAYSGNPTAPGTNRWGDTFDVRGSGNDIQILAGTRNSNVVAIFTTADGGDTFTAIPIRVPGVTGIGPFGLGLAFGAGNTFWAKAEASGPLRHVQFDLTTSNGTVLHSYASPGYVASGVMLAVNTNLSLLAAVSVENPDNLRLYTTFNPANPPTLIDQELFPTDNENTFMTGALDFGPGKLFALDSNNGILAMSLGTIAVPPGKITITRNGNTVQLNWTGTFTLQSSTNVVGPYLDVGPPGSSHSESTVGVPEKYFRLRN